MSDLSLTLDLNAPVTAALWAAITAWAIGEWWAMVRVCPYPSCGICGGGINQVTLESAPSMNSSEMT